MRLTIGDKLRKKRADAGLTQAELGAVLGKTGQAISEIERGRVQVGATDLEALATHLETPISFFFDQMLEDQATERVLFLLGNMPPDLRNLQLPLLISFLEFRIQTNKFKTLDLEKEAEVEKYLRDFYNYLLTYLRSLEKSRKDVLEIKNEIETLLELI